MFSYYCQQKLDSFDISTLDVGTIRSLVRNVKIYKSIGARDGLSVLDVFE